MINGDKEYQKEALQLLYWLTQSGELLYQQALEKHVLEIKKALEICLVKGCDVIKYFVLKMLNEWFEEAPDHLIVSRSVTAIVSKILDPSKERKSEPVFLHKYVIPLCSKDTHPRVQILAVELLGNISTSLSSSTNDMVRMINSLI